MCFLHLLHPGLPRESVLALLRCLSQDTDKNPWVCALVSLLHKDIGVEEFRRDTLLTRECVLNLKDLCDRFKESKGKRGWELCLNEYKTNDLSTDGQTYTGFKKRKSEITDHHMDANVEEPESKRRKIDLAVQGVPEDGQMAVGQEKSDEKTTQLYNELELDTSASAPVSKEDCESLLPDHIKVKLKLVQIIKHCFKKNQSYAFFLYIKLRY